MSQTAIPYKLHYQCFAGNGGLRHLLNDLLYLKFKVSAMPSDNDF